MNSYTKGITATRQILALLLGVLASAAQLEAADKHRPPDFSKYPPVLGFLRCINLHANAALNTQQTNLLLITEFYRMDRIGGDMLQYVVTDRGQAVNYFDDGNGNKTDRHEKQLSASALKKLNAAVNKFAATNQ